jgi:hypothetical protein
VATTSIPVTLTIFNHPERTEEPYTVSSQFLPITDPAVLSKYCPPYTGRIVSSLPGESDVDETSSGVEVAVTSQSSTSASNASQTAGGQGINSTSTSTGTLDQVGIWSVTPLVLVLFCIFLGNL